MNLLPKEHGQFAKEGFWDDFFKARGNKAFDWYGEYAELCGVIHKYVKPADQVLMVGCGNSKLSEDLYDLSYHNIHNIDISDTVIKHMKQRNGKRRPKMSFTKMDATQMTFEDESFKSAIDKGTLDALLPDIGHASLAMSMLSDVWRVVKCMGSYMIISLAQDHVFRTLVDAFKERPCIFRVHKLPKSEGEGGFVMPVFAFVITKLRQIPGMQTIWESSFTEGKNTRHSTSEEMVMSVKEVQYYAMLQNRLSKGHKFGDGEQPRVTLYSDSNANTPRYTLHVVDSRDKCQNMFAVFICPQGQESNPMFSTNQGRLQLSSSVDVQRLLVVSLSRGHVYADVEQVKAELSCKVMELAPSGTREHNVPFLSMAEGIGIRNVIHQVESKSRGVIYVEDVDIDAHTTVRQTFCETLQSEEPFSSAKLKTVKSKKGSTKVVEVSQLLSDVEKALVSIVCFSHSTEGGALPNLLIIGLKCGTLATFISHYVRGICIKDVSCIETEPVLVNISQEFYSLDERITLTQVDTYSEGLKQHPAGGYGCIIVNNGQDLELVEECLPLLSTDGILVVRSPKEKASSLVSWLSNKFSHSGGFDFGDTKIGVGSQQELNDDNKIFRNNISLLQKKLTTAGAAGQTDGQVDGQTDGQAGDTVFDVDMSQFNLTDT